MSAQSKRNSILEILGSLGWPLILGLPACIGFFTLIKLGHISNELVVRYCAGHPVSFITTGMFFIGLAALVLKLANVMGQYMSLGRVRLPQSSAGGQKVEECSALLERLNGLGVRVRNTYLWQRLHDALQYVERKKSADGLDEELKYLADMDAERQHESYSLVRIITWATPMLGFLGTVIGIAAALGDLQLTGDYSASVDGLKAGLYVAFDTTALALCFTIAMMFFQFMVERLETQLLANVDARVGDELVGRFEQSGSGMDPHVKTIERMGRSVVEATEQLVLRQSQIWQQSIESAGHLWTRFGDEARGQLESALSHSLEQSLHKYAAHLAHIEKDSAEQLRQRWEQWQVAMSENARILHAQQKELAKQGEIMLKVVQATGDVVKLEKALNENLNSLAGAKNFEDTVMSLSAAIHLLNSRLGHAGDAAPKVELGSAKAKGRAA